MMKRILILIMLSATAALQAQFTFLNPSFEGTSQPHVVPGPWNPCFGSPDTQPGQWGITQPPTDGNTYVSFLVDGQTGGYREGASQQMNGCFTAGQSYTFTMDIAFSPVYNTAEPGDCYGSVAIWGGNSLCDDNELLWSSGAITTGGWNNVTVTFVPTQNWCFVTFAPIFITSCTGYINGMVDNISPIVPTDNSINIVGPSENANIACDFLLTGTTDSLPTSVTLFGNFVGSPQQATILNSTNWQANIDYPNNLSGPQTIVAVGLFPPNGELKADTLHFNLIDFDADFTADTACSGTPTQFTSTSTVTAPGTISNYLWTFEPGQTSTLQNPTYTYVQPGPHSVQLIITSNPGCTDTITKQVLVLPSATADFALNAGCFGIPVTFTDSSVAQNGVSITNWQWSFGDNTPNSTIQNPTHTYPSGGTYTVQLIVTTNSGCADTLSQQVTVDQVPTANFSGLPVTGCMPLGVVFTDQSTGNGSTISNWAWSFGDTGTSIVQDPNHTYTTPGTYSVTLIVSTPSNCADTITLPGYITVDPCPDITIVDPQPADSVGCKYIISGTTNIPVQTVTITGDILGAPVLATLIDSTHWQVEVTLNPNVQNLAVLYATGNFGNYGTEFDTVNVIVDCPFEIPNVFTPDGDGINDYFNVVVGATTKYQMDIYNRWGRRVFSSSNQTVLWDGKVNDGAESSAGVYYYIFIGEQAGKAIEKHGTVTILK